MFAKDTKFLVVDDFPTVRKFVQLHLGKLGFKNVTLAEDGSEAFDKLKEAANTAEPFGFVISDLNMPGMSGMELLKACRAHEKMGGLPFLMLTAERGQEKVLEAISAQVSDYMVKPFDQETLKRKLEGVYGKLFPKAASE